MYKGKESSRLNPVLAYKDMLLYGGSCEENTL